MNIPSFLIDHSIQFREISEMLKKFPNDADLGFAVRNLITKHDKKVTAYYQKMVRHHFNETT